MDLTTQQNVFEALEDLYNKYPQESIQEREILKFLSDLNDNPTNPEIKYTLAILAGVCASLQISLNKDAKTKASWQHDE